MVLTEDDEVDEPLDVDSRKGLLEGALRWLPDDVAIANMPRYLELDVFDAAELFEVPERYTQCASASSGSFLMRTEGLEPVDGS